MRTRNNSRQQLFNGWPTNVQDSHVRHDRTKLNLIRQLRFEPLEERRLLALMAGEIGSTGVTAVAGEALLSFSPGLSQQEITSFYAEHGFSELSDVTWSTESEASLLKLVSVPPYMTNDNILALDVDPRVEYSEPNYIVTVDALPDDSLFGQLWGLHNTGQTGGTADADIDAPEAWDIATGSSQIVVGVIDTGIDYSHPDLYRNMWLNQGEIPTGLAADLTDTNNDGLITFVDLNEPDNASYVTDLNGTGYVDAADLLVDPRWADGTDTDGNGFSDDFVGWDFVNNDNAPWDDYGHGTHVAGTVGAMSDNGLGVAGVNWNVQIMPVKFLSASGSGSTEAAVQSVNYSTMMGVNLTNNSWGGGGFSTALYDAIEAAGDANMLFIAAAGNDGIDTDVFAHYPSSYDSDNIISVAATNHNDGRAYFSSYGATTVDLGAPGVSILSTVPGSQYASNDGTSMATPHVAGVAALAWSVNPNATFDEIRDAIFVSADPVASMGGITVTGGRLNAAATLENVNPHRGSVTLDRQAYPLPSVIEIRVHDADLDVNPSLPDTVTVEISSDTETTPEVVVLTETGPSTSAFSGTIALASGAALPDGTLQAVHEDTVTVVYQDAYDGTGPATVSDTAVVDGQGPVITQIDASPGATRAVISWTTDEPADSVVRYGLQPDNLNLTLSETSLTTSHSLALAPLTPLSIYYFEITSADAAGNATTSDIHSFTTLEVSPILFVDDDEGDSLEGYFTDALDANEYPYDVWDVFAEGYSPSTSDLSEYQVVVWNTGDEYGFATSGLTAGEQASISGYLDGGGSLFLSGQDVLYNGVSWEFQSNYLHVVAYASDEEVYRATGVSGDPISDGMDLSLSVPSGFEANYADTLLPDSVAAGIFTATETGFYGGTYQYAATRYPANDVGPFKLVFFAFPFEAISTTAADPNNQVSVMANVIDWLGISAPSRPGIAVSPTSGLETTEAGGTATFSVVLNTQPEFDVVMAVSTSDTSEGLVSAGSDPGPSAELTFTPDNWDEPQTVTVTGVDDLEEDDHITFTIVTAAAVSSDPAYHDLDPADVEVTNLDDDRRYPPVLDLDENNSSGATGSDFVTSFDAGGAPVAISDIDAVLADSDSAMLTSLSVVITNVQDVAEELLSADTTGTGISASYDPATGTLELSGSDTVGNYQQVLRTVTYDNTLPVPNATDRIITFVANDGEQDSNTATTTVSIEGVNKPPVAEANGDYQIRMGSSLYLSGYGSHDPDNGPFPLTYNWDLDDDGDFDDATGSYRTVSWTELVSLGYEIGQSYTISLKVSDGLSTDVDTAQVTVLANEIPNAHAGGAYSIRLGQTLYLNGNQTFDPDNLPSPLTLKWNLDVDEDLGGDPDYDDATGTYPSISWATLASLGYEMGHTYIIALEASDGMDAGVATTEVTVLGNQAPYADPGGAYTISLGQSLYLNANQSYDPDNLPSPLTFAWNLDADVALGGDTEFDDATGMYPTVQWATLAGLGYQMGNTYTIAVAVSDGLVTTVAETTVTVRGNQMPVAKAGQPYTISVGQTLFVNGNQSYDPDNLPSPLTFAWNLDADVALGSDPDFDDATGVAPQISWTTLENLGFLAGNTYDIALEVSDGQDTGEDVTQVTVLGDDASPNVRFGTVNGLGSSAWTTVTLDHTYESMVVIATPNYDETSLAGVTRIRNASGNRFDIRVDGAGGGAVSGVDVHYVVVEEGVYNEAGYKMEAVKFDTTHIDRAGSWTGELQSYGQAYTTPIVVGQVMSYNDPAFSVFWARGSSRTAPPSSSALYVGRHVGEDPYWATRPTVNETIGYFVFEATIEVGDLEGLPFVAGLGGDTIRGITNSPPFTYNYTAMPNAKAAVASQAGMDGGNGGWAVLYGNDPLPPAGGTLRLAIDEDQLKDTERYHTTEQVAYLIIDPPLTDGPAVSLTAEPYPWLPIQIVDREAPLFRRPSSEQSQPQANAFAEEELPVINVGESSAEAVDSVFARLGERVMATKGLTSAHRTPLLAAGDGDAVEMLDFGDHFWRDITRARR